MAAKKISVNVACFSRCDGRDRVAVFVDDGPGNARSCYVDSPMYGTSCVFSTVTLASLRKNYRKADDYDAVSLMAKLRKSGISAGRVPAEVWLKDASAESAKLGKKARAEAAKSHRAMIAAFLDVDRVSALRKDAKKTREELRRLEHILDVIDELETRARRKARGAFERLKGLGCGKDASARLAYMAGFAADWKKASRALAGGGE